MSQLILVREVQNYGGFFGGETVTLVAAERGSDVEEVLTIDEAALANVRGRHSIMAGMLLALDRVEMRVERAELLGAVTYAELREALGPVALVGPLDGPLVLSYRCDQCELWVAGAPDNGRCRVCGGRLV
jgi:hypothetical protein